ncbi:unnamed protein product [Rotaria socialis]
MMTIWMFCRRYFFDYEQYDNDEELNMREGSYDTLVRRCIRILIIEIQLGFIYLIAALVSTYTLNIGRITRMRMKRWIIEGFCAPVTIYIFWYVNDVQRSGEHIYECNRAAYIQFTSTIKMIIFMFVRYTELYPLPRLNNGPISIFYRVCNESDLQYMHE